MPRRPEFPSNSIYYHPVVEIPNELSPIHSRCTPSLQSRSESAFNSGRLVWRVRWNSWLIASLNDLLLWTLLRTVLTTSPSRLGHTLVLLCFSYASTFWAFSQLWVLHPLVDEWLELSPKIRNMEHFFAYEGRLVVYGSLAIPSEAI